MGLIMNIMLKAMQMLPKKTKDKMKAPLLQKNRYVIGKDHPLIEMNLTNFLICVQNCGTCPSYSGVKGEALFCASGKSTAKIEQNGCNCVICPIFDKCGAAGHSKAYFCVNGAYKPQDTENSATELTDLSERYISRFMSKDQDENDQESDDNDTIVEIDNTKTSNTEMANDEPVEININLIGDKEVATDSKTPILKASLDAGIPHTHVCGGRARCSTCRVIVTEGLENCLPRNELEQSLAKFKGFSSNIRLACQTTATSDISVRRLVLDDNDISEAINQGRHRKNEIGKEYDVTIMFSDIRSFTSFSEKALPYDVIHVLNRYFDQVGSAIDSCGGYIDKYMGDGIMVIFGLDRQLKENHAVLAAKAALGMQEALVEFNEYLSNHFNHEFKIGIGIHSGTAIIGNLGFSKKKEYTALGDTVNTASRIESLNKKIGSTILVSEKTYNQIQSKFLWGKGYRTKVKGKEEFVVVYELKGGA